MKLLRLIFINVLGFHNRWNSSVGIAHPNLWIFLRKIKDEEKNSRTVIRSAEQGNAPARRNRRHRLVQKRIKRLKRDYAAGRRSLGNYWAAVSYSMQHF